MRPTGNMTKILLQSRFSSLPRTIPTFYASPHNSVRCDTQPKYPVPPLERLDLNQQEFQPGARNTNPQQKSRPRYLFSLSFRHHTSNHSPQHPPNRLTNPQGIRYHRQPGPHGGATWKDTGISYPEVFNLMAAALQRYHRGGRV